MLTGELRSQVDRVWDSFWSGGIANPLEVLEQITYLLFLRRLDELQTLEENKSARLSKPVEREIFPAGSDTRGCSYESMRWSRLKNAAPQEMFNTVNDHVFPFLREIGGDGSTYSKQMEGARFTIPTPALLAKVVDLIDQIPMQDRDTKGDLYEYMLGKIASAGQNGQFRTPRHIISMMVALTAPTPKDTICDPASGTCGFLVGAGEYLREQYPELLVDAASSQHFNNNMFYGYDFDTTMLRIGSMNMLLHGVENPNITYRDSLSQDHAIEEEKYSLILANPPFAGSLDYDGTAKDLLAVVKTKKTELLFLALFLKLLKPGGRAAVIVPDGVLSGNTKAHKELREMIVEQQKLDAVISLPSGVFKPYAGVSTAILLFTKTNSGGTDNVWFYDMLADGWSLDDRRQPLLDNEKLGLFPSKKLTTDEHLKNNIPDLLFRWKNRNTFELNRKKNEQSFNVSKFEIASTGYDLTINRYKEIIRINETHETPEKILADFYKTQNEMMNRTQAIRKQLDNSSLFDYLNSIDSTIVSLQDLMPESRGSVNPKKHPDEEFELYSIPAYDKGNCEILKGKDIGSSKQIVFPGDILISKIVPHIRRSWIVPKSSGKRQIASGEWIVFSNKKLIPEFFRYYLLSNEFHAKFMSTIAGVGGSLMRAKPSSVKTFKFLLPSVEAQKNIAEKIIQLSELQKSIEISKKQLITLEKSLQHLLFSKNK